MSAKWCPKHEVRWGYHPDCGWSPKGERCPSVVDGPWCKTHNQRPDPSSKVLFWHHTDDDRTCEWVRIDNG